MTQLSLVRRHASIQSFATGGSFLTSIFKYLFTTRLDSTQGVSILASVFEESLAPTPERALGDAGRARGLGRRERPEHQQTDEMDLFFA